MRLSSTSSGALSQRPLWTPHNPDALVPEWESQDAMAAEYNPRSNCTSAYGTGAVWNPARVGPASRGLLNRAGVLYYRHRRSVYEKAPCLIVSLLHRILAFHLR